MKLLYRLREIKRGEHGRVINVPDVAIRGRTGLVCACLLRLPYLPVLIQNVMPSVNSAITPTQRVLNIGVWVGNRRSLASW